MALKRLVIDGFGQVELNNVAFGETVELKLSVL